MKLGYVWAVALCAANLAASPGQAATGAPEHSPIVTLTTTRGDIVIKLFPKEAPITCANFIKLAKSGFYNGKFFHRITSLDPSTPSKIVQGGSKNGDGTGGPGWTIKGEFKSNGVNNTLTHVAGAVAMARKGALPGQPETAEERDSANSQFYICVNPVHFLDGKYAVFGMVISGLSAADRLVQHDPATGAVGDKITRATVTE
jgi:peptidyl-prolyl cis-trans isomerase B (cyclophilin B)